MDIPIPAPSLLRGRLAPLQAAHDGTLPPRERLAALAGEPPEVRRLESRAALGRRRAEVLAQLRLLREGRGQAVPSVAAEAGRVLDLRAAWAAYRRARRLDRSLAGRGEG